MDCGELANKPGTRIPKNRAEPIDCYREFVGRGAHDFFGFIFGLLIGVNEPAGVSEFGLQN